ncbi:hypothetical protein [Amycolatopsis jejuensis]|uniref:hypothetical protein n=1 Tax=Amycolatopsis jejuensis TaxID=330084 RepID=UPI0005271522|nr:hypothetical protein [Amycolatopsis jejuensis]
MSHDRTGERIDDDEPQLPLHDPRCDGNGWVDRDADHPRPCYDCRPKLRPPNLRRALLDADQLRQEPRNPEGDPDA